VQQDAAVLSHELVTDPTSQGDDEPRQSKSDNDQVHSCLYCVFTLSAFSPKLVTDR
jgi:hypothetical protein